MHKINLQLFAEPTGTANSSTGDPAQAPAQAAAPAGTGNSDPNAGKTYTPEEIDKLVEEKATKKADAIRLSMYQQEGMTEADAKAALNDWKAKKASEAEKAKGDLTKQQQRADEAERKLAERENQIFADLVEAKSEALAVSLGIDPAKLAYIRLDFSKVGKTDTGKPKAEDIKAVLEGALKVMPELKRSTEPIQTGVAPTNGGKPITGDEESIRKAMGLPPKK